MTFLKNGVNFFGLEGYWAQIRVLTGYSATVADFNWSPERISFTFMICNQEEFC